MDHLLSIPLLIVIFFVMLDVAYWYQNNITHVCETDPSATGPACEFGWTSGWEAYRWIVNEIYAEALFTDSYLQYSPDDAKVPLRF
jgi:hypothetical protein